MTPQEAFTYAQFARRGQTIVVPQWGICIVSECLPSGACVVRTCLGQRWLLTANYPIQLVNVEDENAKGWQTLYAAAR